MSRSSSPSTPLAAPLLALLCAWPGALNAADGASQITFDGLGVSPSWSPDGSQIVHVADRTPAWMGGKQLWVISATGSDPTQVTFGLSPSKSEPAWETGSHSRVDEPVTGSICGSCPRPEERPCS